ncbi:hypothetical protein [Spirosoma fluviale]|uniref:Outer membrane protein beta-barrel domain-containing protein n=1 Tax=Spirosoma fluviale TaxID=1597977 RepID=A0A286FEC2_9BACT|nr:hypothetical protein [Spirosoma fluviale]SOD81581.1 hypothetical protein SAMN06269250_1840 [Spirosoma fluviale]
MQTITRLSLLALAFTLSLDPASAQQPVRRTAAKPATRPATTSARTSVGQTQKTTPAAAPAAKSEAQPQTPVEKPAPAPVAVRQTESHPHSVASSSASQSGPAAPVKANGDKHVYVNAGVGLAAYYGGGLPLGVSAEVDVKNNVSVGGSVDYFRYNYGYYSGGYTFIYAGGRVSYHLGDALRVENSNFDPYIGASLGFRHASYRDSYGNSYSDYGSGYNSGLWLGIHAGARYLFSPKVGAFAEVGYGVSALKLGLTAKF